MSRSLFIITQKYPLLNAINIKLNCLNSKEADLILDDDHDYVYELASKIIQEGIFRRVFIFESRRKNYIKDYFKKKGKPSLTNMLSELYLKLKDFVLFRFNLISYINNITTLGGKIDFTSYSDVYVCCTTRASFACTDILEQIGNISTIHLVEEGVRDYCQSSIIDQYIYRYRNLRIIQHLYDSELVSYEKRNIDYCDIPKLAKNDATVSILNRVFGWNNKVACRAKLEEQVIFFEQVAEPMPKHLSCTSFIKRLLLHNSIRKHKKEHLLFREKSSMIELLIEILSEQNKIDKFKIKAHPRTVNGIKDQWKSFVLDDVNNNRTNIPWELYCANAELSDCKLATLFSSSVVNSVLCLAQVPPVKIVLLYEFIGDRSGLPPDLVRFFHKARTKFPSIIYIPNNKEQLKSILLEPQLPKTDLLGV